MLLRAKYFNKESGEKAELKIILYEDMKLRSQGS
jgi:hypothetical protein